MARRSLITRLITAAFVGILAFGVAGIGTAAVAGPRDEGIPGRMGAHITVAVDAVPIAQIGKDGVFTDTMIIKNDGQHAAADVLMTVPFDANALKLVSVKVEREGAWVVKTLPSAFVVDLDRISSHGDTVTVAATFAVVPGYTVTKEINALVNMQWTDGNGRHSSMTDALFVAAMARTEAQIAAPVVAGEDEIVKVYGSAFRSGEVVTFWYNTPTGTAAPLYVRNGTLTIERREKITYSNGASDYVNNAQYLIANDKGQISTLFGVDGLKTGNYSVVARGMTNGMTVVVPFSIR